MKRSSLALGLFGLLVFTQFVTISAHAQTFYLRSWVSTTGADNANCGSRSSPCASFAGALPKTAPKGEINCVESGSYASGGGVTITQPVTIDCAGATGGVSNGGASYGITINAGPSDKVILRNLTINGYGTGVEGVRYVAGGELELDNVTISGQVTGVNVSKSAFGVLSVRNSTFSATTVGIKMEATSASISAAVSDSSFNNLTNTGIEVGKGTYVTVSGSKFTAIYGFGIAAMTPTSYVSAADNVFSSSYIGMSARVAGAKINATGNRFFGNSIAFNVVSGGVFFSGGDNKIDVNPGNPPTGALTSR